LIRFKSELSFKPSWEWKRDLAESIGWQDCAQENPETVTRDSDGVFKE
jgi:hypothetical protein